MRHRAPPTPRGGLSFFLCTALSVVWLELFTLPAAAQEGPLPGTPAQDANPDSPSSPPDLVTIAAQGCTVSEGASITLEDPDGTQAQFVDGQLGIEITSTSEQISIIGPDDDYIGDHVVSFPRRISTARPSPPSRKPRRSSSATRAIPTTLTRTTTEKHARPIPMAPVAVVERVVAETSIVLTLPLAEKLRENLRTTARTPTTWMPTTTG
jgi:hypothetical protein